MRGSWVTWALLVGGCATEAGIDQGVDPVEVTSATNPVHPPSDDRAQPPESTVDTGTASSSSSTSTPTAVECFGTQPTVPDPDYDQFAPTLGTHCSGTDHQDITGVQRVVFLGDSITVGSPPTAPDLWYRNVLADELAAEFGLEPPGFWWENVDLFGGTTLAQSGGDFWSCAEWGARADDLIRDGDQIADCFPDSERDKTTLVIMTVGGNDLASLQGDFQDGATVDELWDETEEFMALARDAVAYLTDPVEFPATNYVVFTNLYEYTDGTGDIESCPNAELAGFEGTFDPALMDMIQWAVEDFMSIAVDHQADMLFLLEAFCGHGFNHDDPSGPCYVGPDTEQWFDLTCIHPNSEGHAAIADMFLDVVLE